MSKAEKERLEREEIEASGFVPNLERLLLAVDDSPNGSFASRLAGLIAGRRGLPDHGSAGCRQWHSQEQEQARRRAG